jgi:hypothetical protein
MDNHRHRRFPVASGVADPSTLQQLPNLPTNFLTIMGISSAAYLGGKAVRKPGPVIRTLAAVAVTDAKQLINPKPSNPSTPHTPPTPPMGPVLVLNLKGENLDSNASVKIDEKILRSDQFWLTPKKAPEPPSARTAELDLNFDVGLIEEVGQPLLEGEHALTLINDDGQSTSARFPIDPMTIEQITKKTLRLPAACSWSLRAGTSARKQRASGSSKTPALRLIRSRLQTSCAFARTNSMSR